jgi:DNA polymerase-3 subunit delta
MKVPPFKIDSFINSISKNKEIFGALVYGPESGLVSINSSKISKEIVCDPADPFLVTNIDPKKLDDDNALMVDEFVSISMLGGRKLIRVSGATNKVTSSLKLVFGENKKGQDFKQPIGNNFILISAKELESSSSLRKFCENNPYLATIACYEDNESTIRKIIVDKLRSCDLQVQDGVVDVIINKFGKNRLVILNELEKLAIYSCDNEIITIDDALNVVADISQISSSEFVNYFADLNLNKSNYFLEKLFSERVNCVMIIRYLSSYFIKLYTVKFNITNGSSLDKEIKSQRIFFKQESAFKRHLNIWDLNIIEVLLVKFQELEIKFKSSGTNAELILSSFNNFCFLKYRHRSKHR